MRKLIILRGAMGSGKSSFISKNNLEKFTLSTDKIRLMFNSLEMTLDYKETMPQFNNKKVWDLLYSILEERMQKGEFTVIDAMHLHKDDLKTYKVLADKYRYRLYIVDFTNISKEELYKRNSFRESYKQVALNSIDRAVKVLAKENIPSSFKVIAPEDFTNIITNVFKNCNKYNQIHIIGDIHGCFTALNEYFQKNPIAKNDYYIFLGDYFDRGIENYKTFKFLKTLMDNENMLFLLGNHEDKLYKYACDDEFKMDYGILKTIEEFTCNNVSKSEIRGFIKKLSQISLVEYGNDKYFLNHGGVAYFPEKPLDYYSTNSFVYGSSNYEVNIDALYDSFMQNKSDKVIQIHGHRNYNHLKYDAYKYSLNLDGDIENGGNLRVINIFKDGSITCDFIKNNIYNPELNEKEQIYNTLDSLRHSKYVYEKALNDNISSFNFTKEAFYSKIWNNMTTQARGLFIDTANFKIVARSYNKFFNIDEHIETKLDKVKDIFVYPVNFYLKYNGFLGILSLKNDEFFFASKSSDDGLHATYFKDIFNSEFDDNQKKSIKELLKKKNISLVFEVIDIVNDPHIIEYKKSTLFLLDAIYNTLTFSKMPYEQLCKFSKENDIQVKALAFTATTKEEFQSIYDSINSNNYKYKNSYIEGFVIEGANNFMVKQKSEYYKKWKYLRNRMENAIKSNDFKAKTEDIIETTFLRYLQNKYENKEIDIKGLNIILERKEYLQAQNNIEN